MKTVVILLISSVLTASEFDLPFPSSEPIVNEQVKSVIEEVQDKAADVIGDKVDLKKRKFAPLVREKKKLDENRNMEMAFFQLNRDKRDKALHYFQLAEQEGNVDASIEIAAIYAKDGKLNELESKVAEIADQDLKSKTMTRAAGILSSLPGKEAYEKAVTYYMNVISDKNELAPRALYELGDLMFSRREWDGAIENLVKLIREYDESEYAQKAYFLLGKVFDQVRDKEYARFFYKKATESKALGDVYINEARSRLDKLMPELR